MNINEYRKKRNKVISKKSITKELNKLLICSVILISTLILCKGNKDIKSYLNKNILEKNISFSNAKKLYNKYVGRYIGEEKEEKVFNEKITYNSKVKKDGHLILNVEDNYLVNSIESGVVSYIGNKDNLGNTIIVEGVDGLTIWYSNIKEKDLKIYDYIKKGTIIGESNKKLILTFYKNGKIIDYKKTI